MLIEESTAYEQLYTPQYNRARGFAMSAHHFDPAIAAQVGCNAAVIYQNLFYWAEKNAANDRHFYDGRWWTYNSITAFAELFPYLTGKQIRTALEKLEASGLIISGCYNKSAYDRTKWYAPTCLNVKTHLPKRSNELAQKVEPIPDKKPDIKPDSKQDIGDLPDWMPVAAWLGWVEMRKVKKKPLTARATMKAINKLDAMRQAGQDIVAVLDRSTLNCWADIYEIKGQSHGKEFDGMGITERAARQALHEISGGTGSFESSAGQISTSNITGNHHTIDAMPNAVRSIGYAGGRTDSLV